MWQAIGTIAEMVNSLGQSFNSYDPYGYNKNETAGTIYAGLSGAIDPGQTWEELWNSNASTGEKILGTINPIAGQNELFKNTQNKAKEARRIAEIGTPIYSQFGDITSAGRTSGIGAGMKKTMVKGTPKDQRYMPSFDVSQMVNTGFNLAGSLSNSFVGTSNNTNTTNTNGFDASQIGNMGTNVPDQMFAKSGIYIKPENRGKFNATKKKTGKTTEELTHSKNPVTRKRAIFAQNAKKWKKGEDGLYIDGENQYTKEQLDTIDNLWNNDKNIVAFRNTYKNKYGKEPSRDDLNYDINAAILSGEKPRLYEGDGLYHWSDKYKRETHPTFSNESIYNKEMTPGGQWTENNGEWLFEPSWFNIEQMGGEDAYRKYWKEHQKGDKLIINKVNNNTYLPKGYFAKGGYIKNNGLNVSNTLPNGIYYPVGDRVYNQSYYSERGIYPMRYKVGNDGMNVIAKETAEEYFNNPNNNLIIYPEKNKPTMNKGGIVSMNKIKGPSHSNGGVDKVLNGVPVEVEGGETQINLSDGSKAILNKEQMNMLRSGISLDRIISTMPKNNVIAEDGTFVEGDDWLLNRINSQINRSNYGQSPYSMNQISINNIPVNNGVNIPLRSSGLTALRYDRPGQLSYNTNMYPQRIESQSSSSLKRNTGTNISRMNSIQPQSIPYLANTIDNTQYKNALKSTNIPDEELEILPERLVKTNNNSIVTNQSTNFFDQYNTSLGISALSNAGLNIGNAIANYQALKQNQKEKPPESVGQVSYSPIAYKYIQSQPQLRQLERGYNFANRFARQSGSPEMVGSNLANYISGNEQIVSNTNQQNLQGVTSFAQNNVQGLLQANMANVQGKSKDIDNKLRWDAMMAQIQGQNAQNIYNSMQAGVNLGGQYGQNKLSSDIMRDMYNKLGPQMFAEMYLKDIMDNE